MTMPVRIVPFACAVLLSLAPSRAEALEASFAADVCATNADPCTVTETVHVTPDAVLDFGVRQVQVGPDAKFDFGSGNGRIWCGSFVATTNGDAIVATGPGAVSGSDSGSVRIDARGSCSSGSQPQACVDSGDCQLGSCSARRCSARPRLSCASDLDCDVGPCSPTHRCSGSAGFIGCTSDADCNFGTCPAELTCSSFAYSPQLCTGDSDCDFGTCNANGASITMNGGIRGSSDFPALIELRAADSVTIGGPVDLTGRDDESDGGELFAESGQGDVTISGKIRAKSGGEATGGDIEVDSARDILITAPIDVSGGDFDGGSIELNAARDLTVGANLLASSRDGAGYGGDIMLTAGRDARIASTSRHIRIAISGHADGENFSGDGGLFLLSTDGDATFSNVRILGLGSAPSGFGADIEATVGGDFLFDGDVIAKSRGKKGSGGSLTVGATGLLAIGDGSRFDLRGATGGGGTVDLTSFEGTAAVSGNWLNSGVADGSVGVFSLEACRVEFSGSLLSKSAGAQTTLTAHESMLVEAGSTLNTPKGENRLIYRTSTKPPVVDGTLSPVALLQIDGALAGCPVCGNHEIDETETCDDGNTADGDGCSSACLLE